MLKIRKLQKKDIKEIIKIMTGFPDAYSKDYISSTRRGSIKWILSYILSCDDIFNSESFVLLSNDKIIGHIAYMKDIRSFEGKVYELRALAIDKEFQGKGYGKRLIKYIENELRKIKTEIICMQTGGKDEDLYYEKLGYKLLCEWENYWGDGKSRYVMLKNLKYATAKSRQKFNN